MISLESDPEGTKKSHSRFAIRERLRSTHGQGYLRDFTYGAVDGAITTFAVVSGVAGAGLSSSIVIILGAANLVADGFSMAVSNYLGTRAEGENLDNVREVEKQHIRLYPEGEREEVRQIFEAKGFSGASLDEAVAIVTSDPERWVDTMIQEEYGLSLERKSALRAALVTFAAFVIAGSLPLAAFVDVLGFGGVSYPYQVSTVLTGAALFLAGAIKARYVSRKWYRGGIETLVVGGGAATLAYAVGKLLRTLALT
jgi:vacuolar iron transporter family protein